MHSSIYLTQKACKKRYHAFLVQNMEEWINIKTVWFNILMKPSNIVLLWFSILMSPNDTMLLWLNIRTNGLMQRQFGSTY